ncbi:MAG: UDP-N-acetylglucosamine 1-carboxyvinyltransferase [Patescibacteria group bacterium]|nr:UDP-N-acetylglucosamine 1-carboxyvinyltransferase [Patescibacteria group bacterium]
MKFIITGGKALGGTIETRGFKNAATPIIAATALFSVPCILDNVPKITDVLKLLDILASMGSRQKWLGDHKLEIDNSKLELQPLDSDSVAQIRSSILLIGPLLARFGEVEFVTPGGCKIGSRPIDTHIEAFADAGVAVTFDEQKGRYRMATSPRCGGEAVLKEFSVTATENLLSFGTKYPVRIRLAAIEPHVQDLAGFLRKAGADIITTEAHSFETKPAAREPAGPVEYTIMNDPIEAGTFAALAAATRSNLFITGVDAAFLEAPLRKLKEFGVSFTLHGRTLEVFGAKSKLRATRVQTMPYPGLPTDLQAPFGVLATQAEGASLIFDTMYEGRLKYIEELRKMGADAAILDPHRAIIHGPSVLHGAHIESLDLRAGATLIIAALTAEGTTELGNIEQIDRGYEQLDERLKKLGAGITRVS